jgi:DNA-binding CsgD family transcriptional regulator
MRCSVRSNGGNHEHTCRGRNRPAGTNDSERMGIFATNTPHFCACYFTEGRIQSTPADRGSDYSQYWGMCAALVGPYTNGSPAQDSRLFEVRYQRIRYGMLELAPGYLVSSMQPHILQRFTHLCALIIALAEHEQFVQLQLVELAPLLTNGTTKPLSTREQDILRGFLSGEGEAEMAHRLGVERATIHSHIQGLYYRLNVHSPREALVRVFALRLVDWLNLCDGKE